MSSGAALRGGEQVLAGVELEPAGRALLELARTRPDAALVGGATRDLLRGAAPRELDVVVDADAAGFARELGELLAHGPLSLTGHERFGTALLEWPGGRVDVAQRRAERYPRPGALPEVIPGSAAQDLLRRDFTVNAIAIALGPGERGSLQAPPHALEDLAAGRLRVMHQRSFLDDPTRLLRLARYAARLGFAPEPATARLAHAALAGGALATVSSARIGAELRLALQEPDALAALASLQELGVLAALGPPLSFEEPLARRALALLPEDGRSELLLLATLLLAVAGDGREPAGRAIRSLLDSFEFSAAERERAARSALRAPALAAQLADASRASHVRDAAAGSPIEAVALAGALDERAAAPAAQWLERLRGVQLAITGDDLLAAGVPAGPEIGRRLGVALARKLDGELPGGRDAELHAALEAQP